MSGSEGTRQNGGTSSDVFTAVDIARARHVTEPSRYLVAVLASGAVLAVLLIGWLVALGRPGALLAGVSIAASVAALWLVRQIMRVRLLGAAVRVSERTTPELFRVVETVRSRLGYLKRTDVYVTERTEVPLQLDSLLGTRILIIKGEFIGELLAEQKESELVFLLATYFGALKARYDRLNLILVVLNFVGVLHIFNPFINPWYRATVYSGDQMAYLCCHDLRVSLDVAFRSLVGKNMSPFVTSNGVVGQAHHVHRSLILRLYQWFAPSPHPTNRYLNLLAFAAATERGQYVDYLNTLDAEAARELEAFRQSHPVTGGSELLMPVADLAAGAVLLMAVVAGVSLAGNTPLLGETLIPSSAQPGTGRPSDVEAGDHGSSETGDPGAEGTDTVDAESGSTDTGDRNSTEYEAFIESLPYGFASTCSDVTPELGGLYDGTLSVAWCSPTSRGTPRTVVLYQFTSSSQAQDAFELETLDYTPGGCPSDAPATDTWSEENGDAGGLLGCGTDSDGRAQVVWTDDVPRVFTVATGEPTDTIEDVMQWWRNIPSF